VAFIPGRWFTDGWPRATPAGWGGATGGGVPYVAVTSLELRSRRYEA
jgi:hypothetical protein